MNREEDKIAEMARRVGEWVPWAERDADVYHGRVRVPSSEEAHISIEFHRRSEALAWALRRLINEPEPVPAFKANPETEEDSDGEEIRGRLTDGQIEEAFGYIREYNSTSEAAPAFLLRWLGDALAELKEWREKARS